MRVLAVDPGGTTGWALLDSETREFSSGALTGHGWEHADWLIARVVEGLCDVLVLEDFNLRVGLSRGAASRRDTLSPVRVIEDITYGLYRLAVEGRIGDGWGSEPGAGRRVVLQSSADAKGFATDERLRSWGMYVTPEHARDAMRHAVLYAAKHKGDEAQTLVHCVLCASGEHDPSVHEAPRPSGRRKRRV